MRAHLAVFLAVTAVAAPASAKHAPRLMVMDLPADPAFPANVNKVVNSFLAKDLRDEGFEVLTAADIGAALGVERQKQMLGCGDSSCLAELGGAMGADYILHGELASMSHDTALTLTLNDTKGGAVNQVAEVVKSQDAEVLLDAVSKDIKKLVQPLRDSGKIPGLAAASADAASAAATPSTTPTTTASAAPSGEVSHTAAYLTGGIGALLLVGSAVTGVMAQSQYSTLNGEATGKQVSASNQSVSATTASGQRSTMNAEAWASTGLLAAGVVAVGVGVVMYLTAGPSSSAQASITAGGSPALAWSF